VNGEDVARRVLTRYSDDVVEATFKGINKGVIDDLYKLDGEDLAVFFENYKSSGKNIDDFLDDFDSMKNIEGFDKVNKRFNDRLKLDGDSYLNTKGEVAEIQHTAYMKDTKGYTIDEVSRSAQGTDFEFDSVGWDTSNNHFVGETKSITDDSIDLMSDNDIDNWINKHVTKKMDDYKTGIDSDPDLDDVSHVKYTIPESAHNHQRFNSKFDQAISNAEQSTGLSIEVIDIP